jgi:release factor glutamine methyltransferase
MMKALDGLREISAILGQFGIEDSHKEAEIIFTRCMEMGKVALYRDNPTLSPVQREEISRILERRGKREPLQYIIGHVDFLGLKIHVGPGVLIPRPETEIMADEAIKTLSGQQSSVSRRELTGYGRSTVGGRAKILDLCTGSGCLALALAREFPGGEVFGTDVSRKALDYAMANARVNEIQNVIFLNGDLYEPVKGRRFDIIVSNPPYIREKDICALQPEIKGWEPLEALDGGEDGLRFYREILFGAPEYLYEGGSLVIELGQGTADDVIKIAEESGLRCASLVKDYAGIKRILRLSLR